MTIGTSLRDCVQSDEFAKTNNLQVQDRKICRGKETMHYVRQGDKKHGKLWCTAFQHREHNTTCNKLIYFSLTKPTTKEIIYTFWKIREKGEKSLRKESARIQ